ALIAASCCASSSDASLARSCSTSPWAISILLKAARNALPSAPPDARSSTLNGAQSTSTSPYLRFRWANNSEACIPQMSIPPLTIGKILALDDTALRRLSEFVTPTCAELAALSEAKQERRQYKRNQTICRLGDPVREVYFVAEGWVGGSLEVNFGRQQLAKLYL